MPNMTTALAQLASDEELANAATRGELPAREELFHRHRGLAYRVAYRLLGNEADALDAVQDGFVKVLTHLAGFQGRSSFRTWLLRVVSNAALDLGRQRARREMVSLDGVGPNQRDEWEPVLLDDPGQGMHRQDLRRQLNAALAKLPPAMRQTFVLYAEADLSYREIAETLGISIGTVMSRLYYARQQLRSLVESWSKPV